MIITALTRLMEEKAAVGIFTKLWQNCRSSLVSPLSSGPNKRAIRLLDASDMIFFQISEGV